MEMPVFTVKMDNGKLAKVHGSWKKATSLGRVVKTEYKECTLEKESDAMREWRIAHAKRVAKAMGWSKD